ncbi:MAG: FAD-binding protein, partial [Planctomycetaceae bacterium]|nr:FAD-binding protein [Planctomycetaceae bacterium]
MDNFEQFKNFVWRDVPLAMHSWFQIGGQVDFFAEPRDRDELCALLAYCRELGVPIRVIGFGSNLLISDSGVRGVVIRLSSAAFTSIRIDGDNVIAGGGVKLGKVITSSVHGGLAGLEGLIGIPGTVGGAIRRNTSTNNSSISEYVESLTVARFDGQIVTLSQNDFTFGYQTSSLEDVVILEVVFRLTPEDQPELSKRMQKIWIVRKTVQPTSQYCTGRLFANPRG